ncbi:MAG: HEAT repeat domain-containing protein [Anaerolineales bacterium]
MSEKVPFSSVINALTNADANFPARFLKEFSDLAPADLDALKKAWPQVGLNRKRNLLRDLNAAYKEDTLLLYDDVAQAFLDDPDALVRAQAIRLLEESSDLRLLRRLIVIGQDDPDVGVRTETATVLGQFVRLGEEERVPPALKRQVEEILLRDVKEEQNAYLQRAALESLGYSSRPEVPQLIEAAFERPDTHWAASALLAISRSFDARYQEQVLVSLNHEDSQVRLLAVQAAGELELKTARLPLLTMLEEEDDDEVLEAVIWSLSQIGGEDVRDYLQALLDAATDDDHIEFLEEALANLSFTEDLEGFDLMAYDPDDVDDLIELDNLLDETPDDDTD